VTAHGIREADLRCFLMGSGEYDPLWQYLQELPAFRALLRAVEAQFYSQLPLERPVLDLGCGDGQFASRALQCPIDAGFDPWQSPLKEAKSRSCYRQLALADGQHMPYACETFGTIVSNSVLEHIPDIQPVLNEAHRVLRPGGLFYFCVPGPNFTEFLSIGQLFDRVGMGSAGARYRRLFNRISRHYHCDDRATWQGRLDAADFELTDSWSYFTASALRALEWGHLFGLPSWISKKLAGRWILAPGKANLALTERLVRRFYNDSLENVGAEGAYLFFVAHKRSI